MIPVYDYLIAGTLPANLESLLVMPDLMTKQVLKVAVPITIFFFAWILCFDSSVVCCLAVNELIKLISSVTLNMPYKDIYVLENVYQKAVLWIRNHTFK